jgi:hypothetical protein
MEATALMHICSLFVLAQMCTEKQISFLPQFIVSIIFISTYYGARDSGISILSAFPHVEG